MEILMTYLSSPNSYIRPFYKNWGCPPERVAKAVLKAVKKNKGIVPVEPEAWLFGYIKRFSQKLWELYMRLTVKFAY